MVLARIFSDETAHFVSDDCKFCLVHRRGQIFASANPVAFFTEIISEDAA